MYIGYIRVSTDDQNLSLQKDALLKYGDTLVVWKLDRLGRSYQILQNLYIIKQKYL